MTINLTNAIDRMVEIQIACMAALTPAVTADAVAYFFHSQEETPYFTNRMGVVTVDDLGEDIDRPAYAVIARLVIDHITADYEGNNEAELKKWIPAYIRYFHARPWLESATQTNGLDNLLFARITDCTGFRVFQNAGLSIAQVGCEFTHRLEFEESIQLISG